MSILAILITTACAGSPEIKGNFPRYAIPKQPPVHFLTQESGYKCITPKEQRQLGKYLLKLKTAVQKYDSAARIWNGDPK